MESIIASAAFIALSFHVSLKWGIYNFVNNYLQMRWGRSICVLCTSFWAGVVLQVTTNLVLRTPIHIYELLAAGALAVVFTLSSLR
jgi:hypothetical protein